MRLSIKSPTIVAHQINDLTFVSLSFPHIVWNVIKCSKFHLRWMICSSHDSLLGLVNNHAQSIRSNTIKNCKIELCTNLKPIKVEFFDCFFFSIFYLLIVILSMIDLYLDIGLRSLSVPRNDRQQQRHREWQRYKNHNNNNDGT